MMASTGDRMPGKQSLWVPLPTLGLNLNLPARLILVAAHSSTDRASASSVFRNLPTRRSA